MHYRYDPVKGKQLKTVKIVVSKTDCSPPHRPKSPETAGQKAAHSEKKKFFSHQDMKNKTDIIKSICEALSSGNTANAAAISRREYSFSALSTDSRKFTEIQALRVFMRDGFIDRYSGNQLLFPPVLRILSSVLPAEFPFHRNWKMSETHQSYWELFPTLDHIVPVARGGADKEDNIVSTSMLRNSAKSNWTLEELCWSLQPPGDIRKWDGMFAWFMEFIDKNPQTAKDKYISRWYRVARQEGKFRDKTR